MAGTVAEQISMLRNKIQTWETMIGDAKFKIAKLQAECTHQNKTTPPTSGERKIIKCTDCGEALFST